MSQFFFDADDHPVGPFPNGWATNADSSLVDATVSGVARRWGLVTEDGSVGHGLVGASQNLWASSAGVRQVYAEGSWPTANRFYGIGMGEFGIDSGVDAWRGYSIMCDGSAGEIIITNNKGTSAIAVASDRIATGTGPVYGNNAIVRFRMEYDPSTSPATIRGKAWQATDPEPESWQVTAQHADYAPTIPMITLARRGTPSYWSVLGFADQGDVAPTEAVDEEADSPPQAPTGLTATAASDTRINLEWQPTFSADGYRYRVDGGAPVDVGSAVTASVTGLAPETAYTFEVQAYNQEGDSPWSDPVTETTQAVFFAAGWYWWDVSVLAWVPVEEVGV